MSMQIATTTETLTFEAFLNYFLADCLIHNHQFAIWRNPHSSILHFLIDKEKGIRRVPLQLEELSPGFVVHPFEDQEDEKAIFLKADAYFKISFTEPDQQELIEIANSFTSEAKLEPKSRIREAIFGNFHDSEKKYLKPCKKGDFLQLVEKSIDAIKSGSLHKVVPARIQKIHLNENFDLAKSLLALLNSYPNAFVNFFHIPTLGTWIGASPEVLIKTRADEFFTMSLAGTQKAKGSNPLKSAAWTQKEIEEQALVSRYIVDCFKKIRLREYDEQGPKTVLAGNLLHLRSDFRVNMKETNFPQLGSVMLRLLHPTSAVCGMPRKEAFEFIAKHEGIDRSLFAGFIGPVNLDGETAIYVNLRTARIMDGAAMLYAGAGVTEDSIPEKEWEETEMKFDIIGKYLKNPKP